jgi:pantoate--beta-alanine ligase
MALDLNIPIKIISVATVREADGLAMSSRNGYLNPEQRQIAPVLYRVLCTARESIMAGVTEFRELEALSLKQLQIAGFVADYFSICRSADLMPATSCDLDLVILVAARLGKTRLIDNICFSLS